MKLSHALGAASALAAAALSATIALACPAAPPPAACPPLPCGGCGCNISDNKAWMSGTQSSSASGHFWNVSGSQLMDLDASVKVGSMSAKSETTLDQNMSADKVTMMTMGQTGAAGASLTGPNNQFPAMWTGQTMGSGTQGLNTWGKNITHHQFANTDQRSQVGGNIARAEGEFISNNSASGWGDLATNQSFSGGTKVQGWDFIPFPMAWGANFNLGNQHGILTLTQFAQLNFI